MLDTEALKTARDQLKTALRELDADQRRVEAELKGLRQKEIRMKRELEALSTLLELRDPPAADGAPG